VITFSDNLLFIGRFNAAGALETSYDSETYRRSSMLKPSPEYDGWMAHDIAYWRFVEIEDVELAISAQKGFKNGVLGQGRLHSIEGMSALWMCMIKWLPELGAMLSLLIMSDFQSMP